MPTDVNTLLQALMGATSASPQWTPPPSTPPQPPPQAGLPISMPDLINQATAPEPPYQAPAGDQVPLPGMLLAALAVGLRAKAAGMGADMSGPDPLQMLMARRKQNAEAKAQNQYEKQRVNWQSQRDKAKIQLEMQQAAIEKQDKAQQHQADQEFQLRLKKLESEGKVGDATTSWLRESIQQYTAAGGKLDQVPDEIRKGDPAQMALYLQNERGKLVAAKDAAETARKNKQDQQQLTVYNDPRKLSLMLNGELAKRLPSKKTKTEDLGNGQFITTYVGASPEETAAARGDVYKNLSPDIQAAVDRYFPGWATAPAAAPAPAEDVNGYTPGSALWKVKQAQIDAAKAGKGATGTK